MKFLLWIDGVGGYLVCQQPRLTLGQAGSEATADLAIWADIKGHHATLHRDAEGYCLEALGAFALNGQAASKVFLSCGDRLTLGTTCQLSYTRPVPLSASARLDLVSGQRWQHPVNAALLMAETLVIGAGPQAHVVAAQMEKPLILCRTGSGLAICYQGNLVINGRSQSERGPLIPGDRVTTDELSLALESAS